MHFKGYLHPLRLLVVVSLLACAGLSPARADGVADRNAEYLNGYYNKYKNSSVLGHVPGQSYDPETDRNGRFTVNTAYAAMALGRPSGEIATMNAKLDEWLTVSENLWNGRFGDNLALVDSYWALSTMTAMLLDDNIRPQISASNQTKMKAALVNFADEISTFERASLDTNRLKIYGSDNHHTHHMAVHAMTHQIIKDDPAYANRTFFGDTAEQRYGKWTTKALDYLQDRAGKGQSVEVASPTYQAIYFNGIMQFAEYAEDPRLKQLSREYLDLHFADWAQESTEGLRGGSKARGRNERSLWSGHDRGRMYVYPFTGLPPTGLADLPSIETATRLFSGGATTDYRVRQEIVDMISDDDARGTYTYVTNRMAEGTRTEENGENVSSPIEGQSSFLRTTRVTPDYTMGWYTIDENRDYMPINTQAHTFNIITDASLDSRLVFNTTAGDKELEELQGVGHDDAMLVRRQIGNFPNAKPRVYVSNDFTYAQESDGWVFGTDNSGSFFALMGVLPTGADTYSVSDASSDGANRISGNYLSFNDPNTVLVVQMGLASNYANLEAFKADVRDNPLSATSSAVTYNAGTEIKLFNNRTIPQVGGQTVDLTPTKVYDSPYLNADYGSKVVTFTDLSGNSFGLDFNYNPVAPTQYESIASSTTLSSEVFSPGYREMVGVTEFSSDSASPLTYTIDPTAVLQIDFDGFHNVMDTLAVNGTLNLGGELLINMIRDPPQVGGTYQVVDADMLSGTFDTITLPEPAPGLSWYTNNLTTDGTIRLLQIPSITLGDTDNSTYNGPNSVDDPYVDPVFEADIQARYQVQGFKHLDEGGANNARAMTFTFTPLEAAELDSVWIEARVEGLWNTYDGDIIILDSIDNRVPIDTIPGFDISGDWMTLRYELDPNEFYMMSDGMLNFALRDDVRVDWVTLSWIPAENLSADFDGDGDVDGDDLTHPVLGWEARYGVDLDGRDFLNWQRQLGSVAAVAANVSSVPEPTAAILALTGLILASRRSL